MNRQSSSEVDVEELQALYQSDSCARALLDYAASRTRNSTESRVDRLLTVLRNQEESAFSRPELISALKQLADAGAGDFIIGRRGQPSRFQWAVAMISVGKAARGEEDVMIESIDDIDVDENLDSETFETAEGSLRHTYVLRPGYEVCLDLPENLSAKEAARLSDFVRTLPFGTE